MVGNNKNYLKNKNFFANRNFIENTINIGKVFFII